jgi:elongator complex protein 3
MGCISNCIFCPSASGVPKSYTGFEPAIQRAIRRSFDPLVQVEDRLNQYRLMGHLSDFGSKIDVIILGGTFLALPKDYKNEFIKGIYDGLNGFVSENLEKAEKANEKANNRCIGMTIETKPEYCRAKHVDEMLSYGITRVELGVQSTYEDVVKFVERNHTVEDSIFATRIARDAGYKVVYHMMPGLPLSDFERDLKIIEIEIQKFACKYNASSKGNEKFAEHLGHAIGILDHVSRKHNPKPKMEKVNFT